LNAPALPLDRALSQGDHAHRPRRCPRWIITAVAIVSIVLGIDVCAVAPMVVFSAYDYSGAPGLSSVNFAGRAVILAIVYIVMIRGIVVQATAFYEHDRLARRRGATLTPLPYVSVLVPAFNEGETIAAALTSLISLDYPSYEVIVVDDGSTDDTLSIARTLEGSHGHCDLHVFTKPNGGKWSALNHAFRQARADYILCVDADSGLAADALTMLVGRLSDRRVVCVAGQVTIRNRRTLLARFQAAEYLLSNGGIRMALSSLGLVTVVPGPIGLYRRDILERVSRVQRDRPMREVSGPLSGETFAEDFQLSLSALVLGGRAVYEPRAIAYTKCPETIPSLMNQRYRWTRGTWQVYALFVRRLRQYGTDRRRSIALDTVMAIVYPLDIYVLPIINFGILASVVWSLVASHTVVPVLLWIAVLMMLNCLGAIVYIIEQGDDFQLLLLVPFLDIYQTILLNSVWLIAAIDQIRGTRMRWS
jgi:biofilm PGA synthesis N-glycosyltransferase PgaC